MLKYGLQRGWTLCLAGLCCTATLVAFNSAMGQEVFTDPKDGKLGPDFTLQGEYVGEVAGTKLGAQVIGLGGKELFAVIYEGGLPGAGWDGKHRSALAGAIEGAAASLVPAAGERKYLANKADEFSATSKFPPEGHKAYSATVSADGFAGKTESGAAFVLKKTERKSPTLGAAPPANAIVLFDGSNKDEWTSGRLDEATKLLNTDGKDILTKRKFRNYTMHVEFMLPYRPAARGQGRGNSGFYQVDLYEMQILDSFGLEGKNNECGGIYQLADPLVNMCLPPLVWQTYDVEFTSAVVDDTGKKIKPAKLTARHNGVVIHDGLELKGKTGGSRNDPEGTPGPIKLQGHGNPLQFRNVWIVETK